MKYSRLIAIAALGCTAAFAQARPPGTPSRPSQELDPINAGGQPAENAERKVEARKDGMPASSAYMGAGAADAQARGHMAGASGKDMISKKEWDAHHEMMWRKMSRNGMMSRQDMESMHGGN